ncbi:hypothetical protein R3P38DRAFT_3235411 [Favolaschia claudopus]|uniref:MFS general substrate transporter n=1 Tax=Favolaschia claudopus TaxID=2862362 RepID=A0AAV9ZEM8_9AGAR
MAHFTSSSAPSTVAQTDIVEIKDPERLSTRSVEYEHPEGGRIAWLTIAGAWMLQFCTFGHYMMFIGSTFYVLCIILLSLTQVGQFYQVFLAQAVGMGVFPALIFLPSFAIVSHHFRRRRVIAMGIVTFGAAWDGVIFPVMLNQLGKRTKLTTGIRVSGGMIGAMLLFANLTMKTRPAARLFGRASPIRVTSPHFSVPSSRAWDCSTHLYASTNGVREELGLCLLTLLNGGSIFGRLVNNSLAPHMGAFNLVFGSLYACAGLIFVMQRIKTFADLACFAVLYGFMSGPCTLLLYPSESLAG